MRKTTAPIAAAALSIKSMGNSTLKTLMKLDNKSEADVISSILEQQGIYAKIKSFHDTAYDGLFLSQYGGVLFVFLGRLY